MSVADRIRAEALEKGLQKGRAEAMEEALQKGELQSKARLARRLVERGMSISEIADLVELDEARVRELLAEPGHRPA